MLTINGDFQINNNAARGGGGIYRNASGGLIITGSLVLNNNRALTTNEGGGGIFVEGPTVLQKTLYADGNISATYGGAIRANADFTLEGGGEITNNKALDAGTGGGIFFSSAGTLKLGATIDDLKFQGNVQGASATPNAIYFWVGSTLVLTATTGKTIYFYDPIMNRTHTEIVKKQGPGAVLFDQYRSDINATTTVEEGSFQLSNGATYGRATTTGAFTVNTGASLEGSGTIQVNGITVQDGATLRVAGANAPGLLVLAAANYNLGDNLHVGGRGALHAGAALHAASITIEDGGVLTLSHAATLADGGTLAGSGTLAFAAGGGLTLGETASGTVWAHAEAGKQLAIAAPLAGAGAGAAALAKTGAGSLLLAGDNSGYDNMITVGGGGLLFSGTLGSLAGSPTIAVQAGAAFGGAGTVTGDVRIAGGGILQIGSLNATGAEELKITGTLTLGAGGTVAVSLVQDGNPGDNTKLLLTGPLILAGASTTYTIDLLRIKTGVFDLGDLAALAGADAEGHADDAAITLNGGVLGSRQSAYITGSGGRLIMFANASPNQMARWTGGSAAWDRTATNWEVDGGGTIPFSDGDYVVFDSVTDMDNAASRANMNIVPNQVTVSGMEITGGGNYYFSGGAIVSDTNSVDADSSPELKAAASGKLVMQGTGTLTLANATKDAAANNFTEGVDLKAGTLALASAGALGSSKVNITGSDTTIAFDADGIAIGGILDIGAFAATIDTRGHDDSITGGIVGDGILTTRSGTGALTLSGSARAVVLRVENGVLKTGVANILGEIGSVEVSAGAVLDMQNAQTIKKLGGAGTVSTSATLTLAVNEEETFAGMITGDGGVVKSGPATLVLSGSNSHKRGTRVESGTLAVTTLAALGAGPAEVVSSGNPVLEFRAASGTHGFNITGGGRVDVVNGNMTLSGSNRLGALNLLGTAVLSAGGENSLGGATSNITIGGGATLRLGAAGVVVLGNDLTVGDGGTLHYAAYSTAAQKDNISPGSLALGGRLVFEPGARLAVDANSVPSGVHAIATAAGGISNLPSYETPQGWRDITLAVEGDNLMLSIINQAADPARAATMTFDSIVAAMTAVSNRVSESFIVPLAERAPRNPANNLWLKGVASFADYDSTTDRLGHSEQTYGAVLGYDGAFRDRYLVGVYGGWLSSSLDTDNNAHTDAGQEIAGAYAAYRYKWFYLGADLGFGWLDADTSRFEGIDYATGAYKVETISWNMETGIVINAWKGGLFKPMAAIHWMNAKFKDYWEEGPGALRMGGFSDTIVQSLLSLQASQRFTMARGWPSMLDMTIGWRQNHRDFDADVPAAFAATPGSVVVFEKGGYSRGSAVLGLGIRTMPGRGLSVGLAYDYEITMNRDRHTINLTGRWIW
ncbi:MAG: autotransporter domain-containing protein [Opitutaceae bacterium]|nr:autotransporter domain-containing protein [Opitutaceae bacterium]